MGHLAQRPYFQNFHREKNPFLVRTHFMKKVCLGIMRKTFDMRLHARQSDY